MKTIQYILYSPFALIILIFGMFYFKLTGNTPQVSYRAMLRLFYIYGGNVNEFVTYFLKVKKKKELISKDISDIANNIQETGFFLKKNFLSQLDLSEIKTLLEKTKFRLRSTDKEEFTNEKIFFDPNNVKAILYESETNYLLNQKIIQKIISNKEIYQIAREYFKSEPFFDHVNIGISTTYNKNLNNNGDSNAAQLYHFDMDRPKWLKFLIYVCDVNEENGPHCFVKYSHKNNGIPFRLRSCGYVRITDETLKQNNLQSETFIEKAGTAIIEDTRGLHKGEKLKNGHRILMNIQVNNSMFGCKAPILCFDNIHEEYKSNFKELKNVFKYSTNIENFIS
jgi:hypothetical protein